ncbi:bacillithiol biosynthesis cysteine-adding enzyme BshC [Paenibacillus protaetiae]|uniref:Putative cysteine ligase BshC n=1 Tax=Paenibacillus protaetiae TaxID=2509456 RepID=A0A4P6EYW0_9BACL|nr:bacillithiol biosynthesis cysteine-adding enzyme BshC [Paenibacillus protaetiae]QAY68312.1 bacillithiol biosynthesis cysteine-adding enzyme BshC [Paenibacillus protaetiae]
MKTEIYMMPSAQPLTEAYIHQTDSNVDSLYGYHPERDEDWSRRLKRLQDHPGSRADASDVAKVLRTYNEKHHAHPNAMLAIKSIAEGAPVIVGGQQAGLWTGPIMVIHKAITIIQAARFASQKLGTAVVPVFWIAGEDHDWDEANHAYVMAADQSLRKLTVQRPEGPRTAVSRTVLDESSWAAALEELEQSLPHSEFKEGMLQQLKQAAEGANTLSDSFARILGYLFGEQGLVLIDADDAGLRKLESPMFTRLIERNDELEQAYAGTAEQMKQLGYPLQADVVAGSANLFVFQQDNGNERTLLHKRDGLFQDRKGVVSWTKEELLALAADRPEQLSNNVLTRPLMQDYVFPVLATVLGPGEIAYWGTTGEAFRTLGMEMPIILPRLSFTLVEGTIDKHMAKYELSFEDVVKRFDERKEAWLKEQDQLSIEEKFAAAKQAFNDLYEPIVSLAASVQQGLAKLGETNRQKIVEQIEYLESKTKDAFSKQYEASIRQLDRIYSTLCPEGKPQERVVNCTVYWNRFGQDIIGKLLELPFDRSGTHRIVYLSREE